MGNNEESSRSLFLLLLSPLAVNLHSRSHQIPVIDLLIILLLRSGKVAGLDVLPLALEVKIAS